LGIIGNGGEDRVGGRGVGPGKLDESRVGEFEIGVQLHSCQAPVFSGGEDQQPRAGLDGDTRREGPLAGLKRIVGEFPPGKIGNGGARIVQLDPIR